ncbi:MAG: electron transport complex subunit RsxC [Actinobacteria bacterium]|nr:electron transport complex subunit RsxC [Actinomycetota bacterium]
MGLTRQIRRTLLTKGGVHPKTHKYTASMKIAPGPNPERMVIPLSQHIGAPCEPVVEPGQRVLVGQKIGDSKAFVSAPVHSSVSGEVKSIGQFPHPLGNHGLAVEIASDRSGEISPDVRPAGDRVNMTPDEIRRAIREGGVVGLGGATFPTHVKLSPPEDKPIELVIINGAECEPYLTGDHRLMVERTADVIEGALLIRKAVGAKRIVIAIERNKPDAIEVMNDSRKGDDFEVVVLPARYPQGAEKTLIKSVTGREVPAGGLPMDVGVVVDNVGTAVAVRDCIYEGMPVVERIVTVSGDGIAGRGNLKVKIGTSFHELIEYCGGYKGEKGKLLMGGPMMGLAQYTDSVPVIKGTSGIIALAGETVFRQEPAHFVCIRCGRCVRRCPMNLLPYQIGDYCDAGMWEQLEGLNIEDCVECGCCSYICPTKNPLVQLIKVGKEGLDKRKKKIESLSSD